MSFEITSPSLFDEVSAKGLPPLAQSRLTAHVETLEPTPKAQPHSPKEICYESIERQRWEDEGGAHSDNLDLSDRPDSLDSSVVETHLTQAHVHFARDNVDGGTRELIAAAERANKHRAMVLTAMDHAISALTTLGHKSAPPHPQASTLVRARNAFLL
jgi:hypothetical protein